MKIESGKPVRVIHIRRSSMDKKEVLKMFEEEISGKVDPDTLEAVKNAKSKKEA